MKINAAKISLGLLGASLDVVSQTIGISAMQGHESLTDPEVLIIDTYDTTIHKIESIPKWTVTFNKNDKSHKMTVTDLLTVKSVHKTIKNNSSHKGANLGGLLSLITSTFKTVTFELYTKPNPYHFEQPDFLIIALLLNYNIASWDQIKLFLANNDKVSWFTSTIGCNWEFPCSDTSIPPQVLAVINYLNGDSSGWL